MKVSECSGLWAKAGGRLWTVVEEKMPFLEPDWSAEDDKPEAVVRIFTSEDEAKEYELQLFEMGCLGDGTRSSTELVDLAYFFGMKDELEKKSLEVFESSFRLDLCKLVADDFPISLDTIYCSKTVYH